MAYPIFGTSANEVRIWKRKFKCVGKEDLVIWGDYNSAKAQQLAIRFKMCDSKEAGYCHSEEETREWLKRKFVVLLYNQIRFAPTDFFEKSRVRESRISYIPISS